MVVNGHAQGRSARRVNGRESGSPAAALYASLIEQWLFEDGPVTWTGSKAGKVLTDGATASGSEPGVIGNAVNIPDGESLTCTDAVFNTASFTLEAFYRRTYTVSNSGDILQLGSSIMAAFNDLSEDSLFTFKVYNSTPDAFSVDYVDGATPLTENVWYHLVGTYDGTSKTVNLYVDGASQGTATLTGTRRTTDGLVRVVDPGAFNVSQFDTVRYFNRAITDAEVSYLYNGGAGRILTP